MVGVAWNDMYSGGCEASGQVCNGGYRVAGQVCNGGFWELERCVMMGVEAG